MGKKLRFYFHHGQRVSPDLVILEGLGGGSYGEVYEAVMYHGEHTAKTVALKYVYADRYELELAAAKELLNKTHPFLIGIIRIEETRDEKTGEPEFWIVMDYAEDGSLADEMERNPSGIEISQAVKWTGEILQALSCLHSEGILHRDLKPANVLLHRGYAKIGDYGLAKVLTSKPGTRDVGTPGYQAPEVSRKQPYDHRADLYSVGCIFYEMLTGRLPYGEKGVLSLKGVPPAYRDLVKKSLATNPDDRYESAKEMLAALEEAMFRVRAEAAGQTRPAHTVPAAVREVPVPRPPPKPPPAVAHPGPSLSESARRPPPVSPLPGVPRAEPPPPRPAPPAPEPMTPPPPPRLRPVPRVSEPPVPAPATPTKPLPRGFSRLGRDADPGTGYPRQVRNSIGMEFVLIPAGEFLMGSPDSDQDAFGDEKPQHGVNITKPFYLGKWPVRQRDYEAITRANPSLFKGPDNPVEDVSWDEAAEFCRKLSNREGLEYGLPTEAQWEYACRAWSTGKWCFGDDESRLGDYAWHRGNSEEKTHPVGEKTANAWGLYDVHGNVWEWCADWYAEDYYQKSPTRDPGGANSGEYRVSRGGSWLEDPRLTRSAYRVWNAPDDRDYSAGFRVLLRVF